MCGTSSRFIAWNAFDSVRYQMKARLMTKTGCEPDAAQRCEMLMNIGRVRGRVRCL